MVDLSGNPESGGPIEHGFSNWVFIVPALITGGLIGFFFYKLIQSLLDKEKKKEEKKKLKQQKKENTKKKVQDEDNLKNESINSMSSGPLVETKSEGNDQMSAFNSGQQNRSDFAIQNNYVPDYNWQANNQNLAHFEETDGKGFNYGDYYNYYSNYYQHLSVKNDSTENISQSNPRTIDLINKALAKQQLKSSTEVKDDDEEEGQIPSSPGIFNRSASGSPAINSSRNSPYNESHKSISRSNSRERSVRSHSRSRKRHISRSRSRSTSRRRRRSRSRSRSPYFGPIIKDYRRGRRGFVRYPRGFRDRGVRPYRRGHHSNYNYYGVSRRHEYSRSRSRSFSPKRRHIEIDRIDNNSDEEKTMDSKHSETLKPSDINESEKRLTQTFLAMLEEKQNRAKMIPIIHNNDNPDTDSNRRHGFVNTFNSVRQMEARKHTLSYDLEREGWQVIDDANTDSRHNQNSKSTENDYYEDRRQHSESFVSTGLEKITQKAVEVESSDYENKSKKKKSKKRKKRKKRKASTSSDSSDSDSDDGNANDIESKPKKKSKKKKKKSKKRKRKVSSSSSSSENEEQIKKKKKKKKNSSTESESEERVEDNGNPVLNLQNCETTDLLESISSINEVITGSIKTKDKKKKSKRKSSASDSSDSDSDLDKKKKKKKKRKTSKKRKHRSSSSSSSDSSDSSDSGDRKKKKKKRSKKAKSKKHKKKTEKKEKSKTTNDIKKKMKEEAEYSEFVSVMSVGEPSLELKWPKKLIKYTICLPPIQYSINPKVTPNSADFRDSQQTSASDFEDIHKIESIIPKESHELKTEYERFIDELNPVPQSDTVDQESHSLESKLRDKLVKQFYDRNESQKPDLMTSSERRAFEKSKKQSYNSFDGSDDHKRHEDLKSAPLSAYYSPKVLKSSPNHKSNDSENAESKHIRNQESDHQNKVILSVEQHKDDLSHRHDSKGNSKTEDKKITAKDLLERVKQRKHSDKDSKESENKEKPENKSTKKLPQIGKMKVLSKKSMKKSVTTANADSTQTPFTSQPMNLDMNYDYNWYYNYYMNSVYGIGQYPQLNDPALASAYYAHYSMLTSYDYNQTDLNNWVTQRGYTLDDSSAISQTQNDVKAIEQTNDFCIKTEGLQPSVESSALDVNQSNDLVQQNNIKESKEEKTSQLNSDSNGISDAKSIKVLVSAPHYHLPLEPSNDLKSESCTPPPPPPRPVMTTLTSSEPVTLPNGEVLPAGTKQMVVHPYPTDDPYKFTSEWFCDPLNGQNATQTQTNAS